jgi:hypothetical protein
MKQRLPGIVIGAVGVVLIAAAITARLFTVAPAFERMTDDFRPEMQASELADLRADVSGLSAIHAEFTTKVVPQLATALDQTPQQFGAAMAQQFPAVSGGMQKVPETTAEFNGVLNVLETERARFDKADAIPTKSLPATTVPWALAGAGVVCLAMGYVVSRRRSGALALGLGLALVAAPLFLTLPGKADAADTMNSHLKPVYTAELVAGAQQSLAGMRAMGAELQTEMLPALAGMLQMQPTELQTYLTANFPTVTAGIASMPAALERFDRLIGVFAGSLDDYNTAKGTKLVPIVWILIAAGLLVAGTGGWLVLHGAAGATSEKRVRIPARSVRTTAGHGRLSH